MKMENETRFTVLFTHCSVISLVGGFFFFSAEALRPTAPLLCTASRAFWKVEDFLLVFILGASPQIYKSAKYQTAKSLG